MKNLSFILIIFFSFIKGFSEGIGQYLIYIDSFTSTQLSTAKSIIIEKVRSYPQPASLFREIEINRDNGYIYVEVDRRIENLLFISQAINQGKIDKVGFYNFNRKGYNRDIDKKGNIHTAKEVRSRWVMAISTP